MCAPEHLTEHASQDGPACGRIALACGLSIAACLRTGYSCVTRLSVKFAVSVKARALCAAAVRERAAAITASQRGPEEGTTVTSSASGAPS